MLIKMAMLLTEKNISKYLFCYKNSVAINNFKMEFAPFSRPNIEGSL